MRAMIEAEVVRLNFRYHLSDGHKTSKIFLQTRKMLLRLPLLHLTHALLLY